MKSLFVFIFILSSISPVMAESLRSPSSQSSFKTIIKHYDLKDIYPTKIKYDKGSFSENTVALYKKKFGSNFYQVEFFFRSSVPSTIVALKESILYINKLSESHSNIVVRGYIVEKTDSAAADFLLKATSQNPDLFFVDYTLPAPDAFGVNAKLRGVNSFPAIVLSRGHGKKQESVIIYGDFKNSLNNIFGTRFGGKE